MNRRAAGALGPVLTLLGLPAAAHAAETQVSASDTFAQLAAVIVLLLGAIAAGYFFVRPFARTRDWMSVSRPNLTPPRPFEQPPPPSAPVSPPARAPWSTEPPAGRSPAP